MIEKIAKWIKAGNYLSVVAKKCGIGERTLYRWLEKGEKAKKGSLYRQLWQAVKKAESDAEMGAVVGILASNNWRALAFFLERRFPERWGKRENLQLTGDLVIKKEGLTREEILAILKEQRQNKEDREDREQQ